MIVPIRPFGGAVPRNYARRRLREFFRLNRELFPENHDVLLRLFQPPAEWRSFLDQIATLLQRASTMIESDLRTPRTMGGPAAPPGGETNQQDRADGTRA